MVTKKIGRHVVEMYDGIEELPVVRFHKYQKFLLVDAGIGGDMAAFDQRVEKARRFMLSGKTEQAVKEFENLRQCVFFIQQEITPRHRAFAALVTKVDGHEIGNGDDALAGVLEMLADVKETEIAAQLDAVKKKIDAELMLYFPRLFNDSSTKEYYDIMRRRALAILQSIAKGEEIDRAEVERLTTELITYSKPQTFAGSEGAEIRFDRQFEDLCLALSEQLHVKPKELSVLEFYNAFDFLQERARQAEKASKRGYKGR